MIFWIIWFQSFKSSNLYSKISNIKVFRIFEYLFRLRGLDVFVTSEAKSDKLKVLAYHFQINKYIYICIKKYFRLLGNIWKILQKLSREKDDLPRLLVQQYCYWNKKIYSNYRNIIDSMVFFPCTLFFCSKLFYNTSCFEREKYSRILICYLHTFFLFLDG